SGWEVRSSSTTFMHTSARFIFFGLIGMPEPRWVRVKSIRSAISLFIRWPLLKMRVAASTYLLGTSVARMMKVAPVITVPSGLRCGVVVAGGDVSVGCFRLLQLRLRRLEGVRDHGELVLGVVGQFGVVHRQGRRFDCAGKIFPRLQDGLRVFEDEVG